MKQSLKITFFLSVLFYYYYFFLTNNLNKFYLLSFAFEGYKSLTRALQYTPLFQNTEGGSLSVMKDKRLVINVSYIGYAQLQIFFVSSHLSLGTECCATCRTWRSCSSSGSWLSAGWGSPTPGDGCVQCTV